ncbi:MAG: hypothetical protein ABI551_27060 [Polyangiaceae bacterium]
MAVVSRLTSRTKTTAGQTIGKYSIVRELGARRPSMFLATGIAPSGATDFAVLELAFEGDQTNEGSAAFVLRARRLAQIRHPNVGRIRDVMVQKDRVALVSDYIEGETLATLLEHDKTKRFGLVERLRVLVDVLSGLSSIHLAPELPQSDEKEGKSPIFGALHPGNVVVGTDGTSRLIRLVRLPSKRSGSAFESPRYAAPELLLGDETSSVRADLYAVGVLLWEALSDAPLFEGENAKAILARQLAGPLPVATVSEKAEWANALVEVATRALDVDPEKRFASAAELAGAIRLAVQARLASTAKLGSLVKDLGKDAIAARQALLKTPTKAPEAAKLKPIPRVERESEAPKAPPLRAATKTVIGVPKLRAPSYEDGAELEMETVDEAVWAHEAPTGRGETLPAKHASAVPTKKSMPPPLRAQHTLLATSVDSGKPLSVTAPGPIAPTPPPPPPVIAFAPIPSPIVPNVEVPPPPPMVTPPPAPVALESQPQTLSPATSSRPVAFEASASAASTQRSSRSAMGVESDVVPQKKKRRALVWLGSAGATLLLLFVVVVTTRKSSDTMQPTTTSAATTTTTTTTTTTSHDEPLPVATQAEAPVVTTTVTLPPPPLAFTAEPVATTEPETDPTPEPTTMTKPNAASHPGATPHAKPGKKRPPRSNYEPEGI